MFLFRAGLESVGRTLMSPPPMVEAADSEGKQDAPKDKLETEEEGTLEEQMACVKRRLATAEARVAEEQEKAAQSNATCLELRESAERAAKRHQRALAEQRQANEEVKDQMTAEQAAHWDEMRRLRKDLSSLRRNAEGMALELDDRTREVEALRSVLDGKQAMLDTRTTELREAQAYLSRADGYSHAEVQRMVQSLNDEILQTASLMLDEGPYEGPSDSGQDLSERARKAREMLGDGLADFITMMRNCRDFAYLPMVLQSVMVSNIAQVVNSWGGGKDEEKETFLTRMYAHMSAAEPLSVCGKWRALTAQHARQAGVFSNIEHLADALVRRIVDVLLLSGARGSADELRRKTIDYFGKRLTEVVALTSKLHQAMKEDMLTADFQVLAPRCGDSFDSEAMEDANARLSRRSRGAAPQEPVLCATDLGLVRIERGSDGAAGPGEPVSVVMLKSRVVLTSIFSDLGQ